MATHVLHWRDRIHSDLRFRKSERCAALSDKARGAIFVSISLCVHEVRSVYNEF
jgi:hypothetical protein